MIEIFDDIWKIYEINETKLARSYIVIPTNGTVKNDGCAVMGAGLAKDAAVRWPNLPSLLGRQLKLGGNQPYVFSIYKIITCPVKHNWFEMADLKLIDASLNKLVVISIRLFAPTIYIPRVGCGNGRLDWKDVKPLLQKYLTSNFIIVS